MSKHTTLEQLRLAQVRAKAAVDAVAAIANGAIRSGQYVNNVASFYTSTDCSGTAAFTMNFPEEMFLDQAKTEFVGNFAWSAATYPGSTNPNLDGKPVFVLAVKGEDPTDDPSYSFLNMETLVDTYSPAAGDGSASVTVSGYTIAVNVNLSTDAGNIITKDANGKLYAAHQDISGKADKVSSATSGNFAGLDANGNLTDSGSKAADFAAAGHTHADKADKVASATAGDLAGLDANGNLTDSGVAAGNVMQKVASATAGHIATLNANGEVVDSGDTVATDSEVTAMLDTVWGASSST